MRLKNASRNTIITLFVEFFQLALAIFVPRLIIVRFGSDVNGLTTTIVNILNVINLIQAGATGASIFEMYQPIANNDYDTVNRILSSTKKYYAKLGIVFSTIVIVAAPVVAFSYTTEKLSFWQIVLSMLILGVNMLFSFLFFFWYDILFCAHQKKYYVSISTFFYYLTYYGLVFVILKVPFSQFYWMYIAALIGNVVKLIVLFCIYKAKYSGIVTKNYKGKEYKIKNRYNILFQQVSTQATEASVSVVLSYSYGLNMVSVFSVYNLIRNVANMIMFQILYAIVSVFGNVVYSESDKRKKDIFDAIHIMFYAIGTWLIICVGVLALSFVKIYTHGIADANYFRIEYVIIIVLYLFVILQYIPTYLVANVYGFYKEITKYYIAGFVVSLASGILIGRLFDWFIVLMPSIMYFIVFLGVHKICKEKVEWYREIKVVKRSIVSGIVVLVTSALVFLLKHIEISLKMWILCALIVGIISAILIILFLRVFEKNIFNMITNKLKNMIKKG